MPRVVNVSVVTGSRLPARYVQPICDWVQRFTLENGRGPTAEEMREEGRDPACLFHYYFEWDDEAAAEQHRLEQAYKALRSIKVTIEDNGQQTTVRAFYPVAFTDDNGQKGYMPTEQILQSRPATDALLDKALLDLRTWFNRYRMLERAAVNAGRTEVVDLFCLVRSIVEDTPRPTVPDEPPRATGTDPRNP